MEMGTPASASSNQRTRSVREWAAQTARPRRSAVADVVQRYGGMSLMVSASQRCSAAAASRMVMGAGLG